MTDEASRVLDATVELSEAERVRLALIFLDGVGDGSSPEAVQAAWTEEAKRRADAVDRGEMGLVDSDEMMARLRARVRQARAPHEPR